MGATRLERTFQHLKAERRIGLVPFVTAGFPDLPSTMDLVPALVGAGADVVELGVPFSDPLADGATIQAASFHALRQGVTVRKCLEVCAGLRGRGVEVPLVLMGYYNPLLAMGLRAFAREAQDAGVDGVIVADLPPEEAGPLLEECRPRGIHWICLLAPTSNDGRIAAACALASGFIYCVSIAGVTGVRERVGEQARSLVRRVRAHTTLPLAVGFGISRPEHLREASGYADAVVVGSALLDAMKARPRAQMVQGATRFLLGLREVPQPTL
ncbi:MAG: tryptophan synthase subunit alpha [Chloroflexi bacterium]|nr:tryptophan synthase subunit alpha [Chloroflexota bacterium]